MKFQSGLCSFILLSVATFAWGGVPSISGSVFRDVNDNGRVDSGESLLAATVELHLDDGDGKFQVELDSLVASLTTDDGLYRFDDLDAEREYFVLQPAQLVGATAFVETVSPVVSPLTTNRMIDGFVEEHLGVTTNVPQVDFTKLQTIRESDVLGYERDVVLHQLSHEPFNPDFDYHSAIDVHDQTLNFVQRGNTLARGFVHWDGIQGPFSEQPSLDLGGLDLTVHGSAIAFTAGTDEIGAGQQLTFRAYSGMRRSVASILLPETDNGLATEFQLIPFDEFSNPSIFTSVDAFQMEIGGRRRSFEAQVGPIGIVSGSTYNIAAVTIPEPNGMAAWGFIVVAVLLRHRMTGRNDVGMCGVRRFESDPSGVGEDSGNVGIHRCERSHRRLEAT